MKTKFPLLSLVFLLCPVHSWAQYADTTTQAFEDNTASPGVEGSSVISPAFRASIRMANPPGTGATRYTPEWRQGAEAFGRNTRMLWPSAYVSDRTVCNGRNYARRSPLSPFEQPPPFCAKLSRDQLHSGWRWSWQIWAWNATMVFMVASLKIG